MRRTRYRAREGSRPFWIRWIRRWPELRGYQAYRLRRGILRKLRMMVIEVLVTSHDTLNRLLTSAAPFGEGLAPPPAATGCPAIPCAETL